MSESPNAPRSSADDSGEISELIESRRNIESWLERLDEQAGSVSRDVLDRVRRDYRERLEEITERLLQRQDLFGRWLAEAEQRSSDAAERRTAAGEELEEGEIRHRIGEWDDQRWEARRAELEQRVEDAGREEDEARADIARLRDLLGDAGGKVAAPPSAPKPQSEASRPTPRLVSRREAPAMQDETPPDDDGDAEGHFEADAEMEEEWDADPDDVTLIPDGPADALEPEPASEDDFDPETIPKPGIKCGNCGYTNDAAAWFCGVCGSDIG